MTYSEKQDKLSLEEAKNKINLKSYVEQVAGVQAVNVGGNKFRINPCPICGHKDHFTLYADTNSYKAFGCDNGGTIIDFLKAYEHLDQSSAVKKVIAIAGGISTDNNMRRENNQDNKKPTIEKRTYDFTQIAEQLHSNVINTTYFKDRGLDKTIETYKLGYSPEGLNFIINKYPGALTEKANDLYKTYEFFIPCYDAYRKCFYILPRRNDNIPAPNWAKNKITKTHNLMGYAAAIFNIRYLENPETASGEYIFVVEGWADALSLEELGYNSIALNSTSNVKLFTDLVKKNKGLLKEKVFILAGDRDTAGQDMNKKIQKALIQLNFKFDTFIIPQHKDINDWLVKAREDLKSSLKVFSDSVSDRIQKALEAHQELKDLKGLLSYNFSDVGNAERFVLLWGDNIRYSFVRHKWYVWNGKKWAIDESGSIDRLAKNVLRKLQEESEALPGNNEDQVAFKNQINSFALKSENDGRIKAMLNQTSSQLGIPIKEELLDKDNLILNCKNGTIDLKDGTLHKHNKENYLTKITPIDYDPSLNCPNWLKFLDKMFMGDKELIEYMQKTIGYSLTGDTSQQCFYMLYGSGANGKSTFLKAMQNLMGDYSTALKGSSLMIRKNDEGARGDLAKLKGTRFVWASELNDGQTFDESLIKSMTGGDPIAVRFLYGEEFELNPLFKLWIGTNEKPKIKGQNHGIWRRVRLIPFEYTIPEEEKNDMFFEEMLLPEIAGILNWAVEGCISWRLEGINTPERVKAAVEDYKTEMDILQNFIDDCCIVEKGKSASVKILYDTFVKWCNDSGEHEMSAMKFGMKMKEKGYIQLRTMYMRYWEGIGVATAKYSDNQDNVVPFNK